jgi:ATP-binding cassette subfamily B protein
MPITKSAMRFLSYFIKQQKFIFFFQFALCFGWAAKESLFPFFIKNMINSIHMNQSKNIIIHDLIAQGLALLTLWIVMEMAMRIQGQLAIKSFSILKLNIQNYLFNYIKSYSYDYFNKQLSGNIANKILELPRACENLLEIFILHLTSIGAAVIIGMLLLWSVDYRFALLFLAWLILHTSISIYFAKSCNQAFEKQADAVATSSGKIVDILSNILNVLLFARAHNESDYLRNYQNQESKASQQARKLLEKVKIYQSFLAVLYMSLMLYSLIMGFSAGSVTVGDFALVPMLSFSLLGMVWWFSNQIQIIFRETGNIQNGLSLINTEHAIKDTPNALDLIIYNGEIRFNQVTFSYIQNKILFDKLNLYIPAKQKIGIVGLSGAGKSTFIKLLLRLYDIQEGHIFIDTQDISQIKQASLREHIAVIPQDSSLFHRSLFENIHYGRLDATEDQVYHAAKIAGCEEFIQQLPHGYETLVGEKGVTLSGGQRQRIGIARAILKDAPILILDEPASALDSITEHFIQTNLENFIANKTVIIIAHRISTLDKVNRILVFDQGKIMGDGDKLTLLQTNSHFKQLFKKQL